MSTVSGLESARTALRAGASDLESPDYAACHSGVNYYAALLEQLRSEFPEHPFAFTLCCGDDPAIAHDALRMGFTRIRIRCSDGVFTQLQDIATQLGAAVIRRA
jgi:hypothetical protein